MHEQTEARLLHIVNGLGVADRGYFAKSRRVLDQKVSTLLVEIQKDILDAIDLEKEIDNGKTDQGREGQEGGRVHRGDPAGPGFSAGGMADSGNAGSESSNDGKPPSESAPNQEA